MMSCPLLWECDSSRALLSPNACEHRVSVTVTSPMMIELHDRLMSENATPKAAVILGVAVLPMEYRLTKSMSVGMRLDMMDGMPCLSICLEAYTTVIYFDFILINKSRRILL